MKNLLNKALKKTFSKLSFADDNGEVKSEVFKVTIELPSDKIANVAYDFTNELSDSGLKIVDQEMVGNSLVYKIDKGDLDRKTLRNIIKESCYGNDMKFEDFKITIED